MHKEKIMHNGRPKISPLFISQFEVDASSPFERHLNRLEVEIGQEDYSQLKQVEKLVESPSAEEFSAMFEITERLLTSTQNLYNRDLLIQLGARIYLEPSTYCVYYRLPDCCLRFTPTWRNEILKQFFKIQPVDDTGWNNCRSALPGFECRFLPDAAGGVLLLRHHDQDEVQKLPLITASHGPYDPHTLEVSLYFLRTGKGGAAVVNLGFAGREPLSDECLQSLTACGVPLNPSNIDVIYPYVDEHGHPYCYKLEEGLPTYLDILGYKRPELVIDVHGCVGTSQDDQAVVVGLGGLPPYQLPTDFGEYVEKESVMHLFPNKMVRSGFELIRELSPKIYTQFCSGADVGYNFTLLGGMQLIGSRLDPRKDVASLTEGEERSYLPQENLRWLPGAGANALQRLAMRKINPDAICMHVEIPTTVRRKMVLKLHALEFESSLDASGL
jgi:hypothetical protein